MTMQEQIGLATIFSFWTRFCFLHISQQKRVGIAFTINVYRIYSEWIKNLLRLL